MKTGPWPGGPPHRPSPSRSPLASAQPAVPTSSSPPRRARTSFWRGLVADKGVDWTRVVAFHMDEYLGIHADHPASFRRYLQEHLFRLVGLSADRLRLIPGEAVLAPASDLPRV